MDKIANFTIVRNLLKQGEIVCISNPLITYFNFKNTSIQAKNDQSRYFLDWVEFEEIFGKEEFYLYEKKKEEAIVDDAKDEEYYSWQHK